MGENTEKVKDLQYSFSGFLWKRLDEIQVCWSQGDFATAIWRASNLVTFLPDVIKRELEPDIKEIKEKMNRSYQVGGSDFHTTMSLRNKTAEQVAQTCLNGLMNKMLSLLDARGYLERGAYTPITKEDFKKLEGEREQSED